MTRLTAERVLSNKYYKSINKAKPRAKNRGLRHLKIARANSKDNMEPKEIIECCLKKKGAYIDFPFGEGSPVIKVENKIFAQIFKLKGEDFVTLNCDAGTGQYYRNMFAGIVRRGYHCPTLLQPYFNTMPVNGVPDVILKTMIDGSYKRVTERLPKYKQKRLKENG